MSYIIPEASILYDPPTVDGLVTAYGYSRDWRFDKRWQGFYTEYIEPLRAIAPAGVVYPQSMTFADWTVSYNTRAGEWYADTYPAARGIMFRDGRIRTSSAPPGPAGDPWLCTLTSDADTLPPNLVLHTIRSVPPPGQGIIPQIALELQGYSWVGMAWAAARLSLILPKHSDDYRNPFLHVYTGSWGDVVNWFTAGDVVSEGPGGSSTGQGKTVESWVLETIDVWSDADGVLYGEYDTGRQFVRSHILIRNTADMAQWWHWSSNEFRLAPAGQWRVNVGGAITWLNIGPIVYGDNAGVCWAAEECDLPTVTGSTWAHAGSPWDGIATNVTGWTAAASEAYNTPPGPSHRPYLTFTRTDSAASHTRPVAWFAYEEHPATITVPEDLPAQETTADGPDLRSVSYEWNNRWKGAQGTAEFYPSETPLFTSWQENGRVKLSLGIAPGGETSDDANRLLAAVATGYVKPGGIVRRRDGETRSGGHQLTVQFGDFAATRLPQKCVVDLRQAGLQAVDEWAVSIANRLGIASENVTVDSAVADKIIPYHELPSLPCLAPQDGDTWASHIEAVERAAGIRVCFDKAGVGGMQVDAGPPKYTAGVSAIAYTLDEAATTAQDQIQRIEDNSSGERFRNFLKLNFGPDEHRGSFYFSESTATREAGIGDDWPDVLNVDELSGSADAYAAWLREHYRWDTPVVWQGPLRRHLRPDDFVRVNVNGLGVAYGTVLQIITHKVSASRESMEAQSECLCAPVITT